MGWTFDTSRFQATIDALKLRVDEATRLGVARAAELVAASAKVRTPVLTGTLRRSIMPIGAPLSMGVGAYSMRVAPQTVYGRRIELGFHGPDSLGRVYDQAGRPYLQPGLDASIPLLESLFSAVWDRATH